MSLTLPNHPDKTLPALLPSARTRWDAGTPRVLMPAIAAATDSRSRGLVGAAASGEGSGAIDEDDEGGDEEKRFKGRIKEMLDGVACGSWIGGCPRRGLIDPEPGQDGVACWGGGAISEMTAGIAVAGTHGEGGAGAGISGVSVTAFHAPRTPLAAVPEGNLPDWNSEGRGDKNGPLLQPLPPRLPLRCACCPWRASSCFYQGSHGPVAGAGGTMATASWWASVCLQARRWWRPP